MTSFVIDIVEAAEVAAAGETVRSCDTIAVESSKDNDIVDNIILLSLSAALEGVVAHRVVAARKMLAAEGTRSMIFGVSLFVLS
jgi:hypothetical protein